MAGTVVMEATVPGGLPSSHMHGYRMEAAPHPVGIQMAAVDLASLSMSNQTEAEAGGA